MYIDYTNYTNDRLIWVCIHFHFFLCSHFYLLVFLFFFLFATGSLYVALDVQELSM